MALLGNIFWYFPFFGFVSAAIVWLIGMLLVLTVIAAPLGTGLVELGRFLFWPFGSRMVQAKHVGGLIAQNGLWRVWGWLMLLLWLPIGIVLAIVMIVKGVLMCLTIVGIPAGLAILKSVPTALNPVGKRRVSKIEAEEMERARYSQNRS